MEAHQLKKHLVGKMRVSSVLVEKGMKSVCSSTLAMWNLPKMGAVLSGTIRDLRVSWSAELPSTEEAKGEDLRDACGQVNPTASVRSKPIVTSPLRIFL